MPREAFAYLWDVRESGRSIQEFMGSTSKAGFWDNLLLRSAVERQFMIIGEALNQLRKRYPAIADRMSECPQIIAFRNYLVHEYHRVDPQLVWSAVQSDLPTLMTEVDQLLAEDQSPPQS